MQSVSYISFGSFEVFSVLYTSFNMYRNHSSLSSHFIMFWSILPTPLSFATLILVLALIFSIVISLIGFFANFVIYFFTIWYEYYLVFVHNNLIRIRPASVFSYFLLFLCSPYLFLLFNAFTLLENILLFWSSGLFLHQILPILFFMLLFSLSYVYCLVYFLFVCISSILFSLLSFRFVSQSIDGIVFSSHISTTLVCNNFLKYVHFSPISIF